LTVDVTAGDLGATIDSPYGALVPTTMSETPLIDVVAGMGKTSNVPSGDAGSLTWSGSMSGSVSPDYAATTYLGMGCARQSATATIGSVVLTDDGNGNLSPPAGDESGYYGKVDYGTGAVTIQKNTAWSGTVAVSARPAAEVVDTSNTHVIVITLSNRAYNFVPNLSPIPAPGSLTVDYQALGKWIRLTDNGKGQLAGRSGEGTGTINYATGSVVVTLGALPDVGSSIIFSWGTPTNYTARNGDAAIEPGWIDYTVNNPAIKPGSLTIDWLEGGAAKTATDDGVGGLSGDGTGAVNYVTGEIRVLPSVAPDPSSLINIAYDHHDQLTGLASPVAVGRTYSFVVGNGVDPLLPGSVSLSAIFSRAYPLYGSETFEFTDDGAGNLSGEAGSGTINYGTGDVSLTIVDTVARNCHVVTGYTSTSLPYNMYGSSRAPIYAWEEKNVALYVSSVIAKDFTWKCEKNDAVFGAQNESTTHDGVTFDLTPTVAEQVVPGSVAFDWAGHRYVDREGSIYRDVSASTNAGTLSGTIDYSTGVVKLTDYVGGTNTVAVPSLLTVFGQWSLSDLFFRTPGSPLKSESFSVRAVRYDDGSTISATADVNGELSAAGISGIIDTNTGVAIIRFGDLVADSSLTPEEKLEDWYDPDNIDGNGNIWRPLRVVPSSVLFNCVVYTYIPLDADILGIDPVRLPQDGRVPMFRRGDAVLVHHTMDATIANPVAGATDNLRPRISFAHVFDANDVPVPSDRYTVDLDAGTITWADPLDLNGYTLPLRISHRIEDLLLCSDVQITGELSFVAALTHDFPANETYVSSCLLLGDLQARVEHLHDLTTFTAWSDEPTGSEAPATYNDVLYPILLTNRGTVEERWRITFTSSTTFNVIGESYGQIVTGGNINDDLAPTNPQTGVPYFFLDHLGWGGGWSTGNTLRFNTRGANFPVWFARTTLQGPVSQPNDNFKVQIRGDAD